MSTVDHELRYIEVTEGTYRKLAAAAKARGVTTRVLVERVITTAPELVVQAETFEPNSLVAGARRSAQLLEVGQLAFLFAGGSFAGGVVTAPYSGDKPLTDLCPWFVRARARAERRGLR